MAFHEKLILLFTSAFDHTICVWNPYIPSLIHKIQSSVNYINLSVIPDSNFLLALDSAGNVKIREVNKFTVISSFSVDHGDKNTDPTCLANSLDPVRYYFGGSAITCYEFIPSDSNLPIESSALCIRHQKNKFKLYCPIRNSVLVWDLLTGTLANTLQEQSPSEITTAELIGQFGLMVIGDADGNLFLRKL